MTMNDASTHMIAAVIPAFNEAAAIEAVTRAVAEYACPIVVDDGSVDGTGDLARQAGAIVVTHEQNKGYDAALESGLQHALSLGFVYAVTLDADGQHEPERIVVFQQLLEQGADLVVGARDRLQRVSERIFSLAGRLLWGIRDPLCGMKGYRLSLLAQAGHFDSYGSVGTELSIRILKNRTRHAVREVLITTRRRTGASRFGSGLGANLKILKALAYGICQARKL